jgi:hypothetical protein
MPLLPENPITFFKFFPSEEECPFPVVAESISFKLFTFPLSEERLCVSSCFPAGLFPKKRPGGQTRNRQE